MWPSTSNGNSAAQLAWIGDDGGHIGHKKSMYGGNFLFGEKLNPSAIRLDSTRFQTSPTAPDDVFTEVNLPEHSFLKMAERFCRKIPKDDGERKRQNDDKEVIDSHSQNDRSDSESTFENTNQKSTSYGQAELLADETNSDNTLCDETMAISPDIPRDGSPVSHQGEIPLHVSSPRGVPSEEKLLIINSPRKKLLPNNKSDRTDRRRQERQSRQANGTEYSDMENDNYTSDPMMKNNVENPPGRLKFGIESILGNKDSDVDESENNFLAHHKELAPTTSLITKTLMKSSSIHPTEEFLPTDLSISKEMFTGNERDSFREAGYPGEDAGHGHSESELSENTLEADELCLLKDENNVDETLKASHDVAMKMLRGLREETAEKRIPPLPKNASALTRLYEQQIQLYLYRQNLLHRLQAEEKRKWDQVATNSNGISRFGPLPYDLHSYFQAYSDFQKCFSKSSVANLDELQLQRDRQVAAFKTRLSLNGGLIQHPDDESKHNGRFQSDGGDAILREEGKYTDLNSRLFSRDEYPREIYTLESHQNQSPLTKESTSKSSLMGRLSPDLTTKSREAEKRRRKSASPISDHSSHLSQRSLFPFTRHRSAEEMLQSSHTRGVASPAVDREIQMRHQNRLAPHASLLPWVSAAAIRNYQSRIRPFMFPYGYSPHRDMTGLGMPAFSPMRNNLNGISQNYPKHSGSDIAIHRTSAPGGLMSSFFGHNIPVDPRPPYNQRVNPNLVGRGVHGVVKKRRKWNRAVFSLMQRRGLEKSFQTQKYVQKSDRRKLADALNLTDAQVKIWFQNRRMKWRQEIKMKDRGLLPIVGSKQTSTNDKDSTDDLYDDRLMLPRTEKNEVMEI